MSGQAHFFATKNDMLSGLEFLEKEINIKYIEGDPSYEYPDFKTYEYAKDIEWLGKNFSGNHLGKWLLITKKEIDFIPRKSTLTNGRERYFMDQKLNKDTVEFTPSGFYANDDTFLLEGRIATISDSHISKNLYKLLKKRLFKGFKRVDYCYVGPEAYNLGKDIKFACINVTSPILLKRDYL